ncbi:MAG TPA: flagellar export chaperone FliS [Burkholderiales bacterium]|nr:flagellar export chaperone FliS [Burkholderiales bacterium]
MKQLSSFPESAAMFGSFGSANAYARVGVQTGVASADPHKLIGMLFDGVQSNLGLARHAMAARETARKGEALSKAIRILEEGLRGSLDRERGGDLAMQLDGLYEYMIGRLLTANLRNDIAALEEVSRLIGELRDAWYAMPAMEAA